MIKNVMKVLFAAAILVDCTAYAADDSKIPQKPEGTSELTQSQLALDHGPRAQVTPAVKRKRLESAKVVPDVDKSK